MHGLRTCQCVVRKYLAVKVQVNNGSYHLRTDILTLFVFIGQICYSMEEHKVHNKPLQAHFQLLKEVLVERDFLRKLQNILNCDR